MTLGYSLGWNIDVRRVAAFIVGGVFLVTGNYLPKFDYIKNYNIDAEKAKKANRFIGFLTVILGILMLITIFLPPIPYAIISILYTVKVAKSN